MNRAIGNTVNLASNLRARAIIGPRYGLQHRDEIISPAATRMDDETNK